MPTAGLLDIRWCLKLIKDRILFVFLPATVDNSLLKHAKPVSNAGATAPVVPLLWKFLLPETHSSTFLLFRSQISPF